VAVERPHDADARQPRMAALRRDQDQCLHRGLPFWGGVLGFGEFGDVVTSILKRDELAPAWQRDWLVEHSLLAANAGDCLGNQLRVSCSRVSRRLVGIAIVREAREVRSNLCS
jgi:hypothetical protein